MTWDDVVRIGRELPGVEVASAYEAWAMVLVALPRADEGLVRELVEDAWVDRAPKRTVAELLAGREGSS